MKSLIYIVAFLAVSVAHASAVVPADVVQSSLAQIQEFLKASETFVGDGEKFGGQFIIEVSERVSEEKLWQIKIAESNSTMQISAAALKKGLSLEVWTALVSQIHAAHNWMPLILMIHQHVLMSPGSSAVEVASIEANALNLLKERLAPGSGDLWNATRAVFDPNDRHSMSYIFFAVYLKSIGPLFGDALERRSDDIKDLSSRVESIAQKLEVVFNQMLKSKLELIESFMQTQRTASKFKHTSESVSELVSRVEKNDREGVAKLLESSLPWDQFTTMETKIYRQFIEAIRRPNKQNSVYLLRGTNPKLDPTPENLGLMSKLFKNPPFQAKTVNEVFAGYREDWANTVVDRRTDIPFPSFFNLGENHSHSSASKDGHPSALVSTSASAPVVTKFAKGSKVMVRVDARRIYPNYESMMYFEREVLVPFFVFPDEIEGELVKDPVTKKMFIKRASNNTVNAEATEFLRINMEKDALALPYIIRIWEKSFQLFFPELTAVVPRKVISPSQCVGFYTSR